MAGARFAGEYGAWARVVYELFVFGIKQAWACLFGALMLGLLVGTHFFYPSDAPLSRYDFLVVAALGIQVLLLATGMETVEEARIIFVYHVVGTAMELFKTSVGSWTYPEDSWLRIGEVPLFSGFMYASVGSYLARVWRLFDFHFSSYPRRRWTLVLAVVIYANFFLHHFGPDLRWLLFVGIVLLYGRTWVYFRVDQSPRSMPLVLGFALVSLFIWFAENIATYARAWAYPEQEQVWHMVGLAKLGSWFLLMNISFVLVTLVHRPCLADLARPRWLRALERLPAILLTSYTRAHERPSVPRANR